MGERSGAEHRLRPAAVPGGCWATPSPGGSPRSAGTTARAPSGGWRWTRRWCDGPGGRRARGSARTVTSSSGPAPTRTRCAGSSLDTGERAPRPWVLGADGRTSSGRPPPGLAKRPGAPRRGVDALRLLGGPARLGWMPHRRAGTLSLMSAPCEDGVHLLTVAGPPELTRGTPRTWRRATWRAATVPRGAQPAPPRGRRAGLPGRRRPRRRCCAGSRGRVRAGLGTRRRRGPLQAPDHRQGIGDALAQGWFVGTALARRRGPRRLRAVARRPGRRATTSGPSRPRASPRRTARPSTPGSPPTRWPARSSSTPSPGGTAPDEVRPPRAGRGWRAAWAYEKGLDELTGSPRGARRRRDGHRGAGLPRLDRRRPPGPPRRGGRGRLAGATSPARWRPGATRPWPRRGTPGPTGTCTGIATAGVTPAARASTCTAGRVVQSLRRGDGPPTAGPAWMVAAPVADLAVHLADLRGRRSGFPPTASGATARFGFGAYRDWLHQRLVAGTPRHPAHRRRRGWRVGPGDRSEASRARRTPCSARSPDGAARPTSEASDWTTDPTPYLEVIAPYPLPD